MDLFSDKYIYLKRIIKMGSYLGKQMEENFDKQQKFMMEMNR